MTTNTSQGVREDPADQAGDGLKERAKEEVGRVVETAQTEASQVVDVAKDQGRRVLTDAQERLTAEAESQTRRASENLRAMSSDFRAMAETSTQQGTAASLVKMGADGIESFADRLDTGGLEGLVQDVGGFARRSPTAFLALTFGAGLLVGRIVKNIDGEGMSQALRDPRQDRLSGSEARPQIEAATS
jgi:vacuolar-type H+-ATPase subunit H